MIFRKDIEPKCRLCANAQPADDSANMHCSLRGTVPRDFACKKFKYDIFKREIKPKPKLDFGKFSKKDFDI